MPPGRSILSFLVRCSNHPVRDARIRITCKNDPNHWPFTRLTTDAAGKAGVELDNGKHDVEIRSAGLIKWVASLDLVAGEERHLEASLLPGGLVRGTARGPDGMPLAQTWLRVLRDGEMTSEDVDLAITSDSGHWEVDNLPPGRYHVEVRCPGYTAQVPVQIDVGRELNLDIPLGEGPALQGSILGEDSQPLPGVRVHLDGVMNRRQVEVETDQLGRFGIAGLDDQPHLYSVLAWGGGFADKYGKLHPAHSPIAPIRLETGGKVVGRILADPFPEHCQISILCESVSEIGALLRATASKECPTFELDHVPSGPCRAMAYAPGFVQTKDSSSFFVDNGRTTEIAIRLLPDKGS